MRYRMISDVPRMHIQIVNLCMMLRYEISDVPRYAHHVPRYAHRCMKDCVLDMFACTRVCAHMQP